MQPAVAGASAFEIRARSLRESLATTAPEQQENIAAVDLSLVRAPAIRKPT